MAWHEYKATAAPLYQHSDPANSNGDLLIPAALILGPLLWLASLVAIGALILWGLFG